MALPKPPLNPATSIPNNPFGYPETDFICTQSNPLIVGSGICINYACGCVYTAGGGGTLTGITGTAPIAIGGTATTPDVSVGTASTTALGVTQLYDGVDSTSTTLALTAAAGACLQQQITALSVTSNLALAGTYGTPGVMLSTTADGVAAGFTTGLQLPVASATNEGYFAIITDEGTYTPPGGTPVVATKGDWFLSDGTAWEFLDVGASYPAATTDLAGIVELATLAEAEAKLDATRAVTPSTLQNYVLCTCFTKGQLLTGTSTVGVGCVFPYSGISGQVLTTDVTAPSGFAWCTPPVPNGIPCACLAAKGDILTALGAATPTALPVGPDGCVLVACSISPTGLCWGTAAPPASGIPCNCLTSIGSLITTNSPFTPYTLLPGANGNVLTACNTCPGGLYWSTSSSPVPAEPLVLGIVYGCTTGGNGNTFLGCNTLLQGLRNIAIGNSISCLGSTSDAIVLTSCRAIPSNNCSVVIGNCTLGGATTGECNVAIGHAALLSAGSVTGAVALGAGAGISGLGGNCDITVIGHNAGQFTQTGAIAIGGGGPAGGFGAGQCSQAYAVSIGSGSSGLDGAGFRSGDSAISIGTGAGYISQSNSINIGARAGFCSQNRSISIGTCESFATGDSSGADTIAIGTAAGVQSGCGSIAIGYRANGVFVSSCGPHNIAIGWESTSSTTSNSCRNIAIGYRAQLIDVSSDVTLIGTCACSGSGNCNVVIGTLSYADPGGAGKSIIMGSNTITTAPGAIAIGNDANVSTPDTVYIQASPGTYRCFNSATPSPNWLGASDARDKTDIQDLALGLDFLRSVQPRTFVWEPRASEAVHSGCKASGFIAQEVLEVLEKHDARYTGIVSDADPEHLALADGGFMPMVINAIKELATEMETLKAELAALKKL
jgi:hypothetical protein